MNRFVYSIMCVLTVMLSLFSCSEENTDTVGNQWSLTIEDKESTVIDSYRRYYNFSVVQNGVQDTTLVMTCDANWLKLTVDTLPKDGIVDFLAEANDDDMSRTAIITIASNIIPSHRMEIEVRQLGAADYADNSDNKSDYAVGWGFNAYEEFKNSASVKDKVIDEAKLRNFDSDTTFQSVQENVRGRSSFDIYYAYSMQEMAKKLTKTIETKKNCLFFKKTVKRYEKICQNKTSEQLYAYARMTKIVASRSIDKGALEYIVNDEDVIKRGKQPFTENFLKVFNDIVGSTGDKQRTLIRSMLNKFGTHVIIDASVGGAIDYMVTFTRTAVSSLQTYSEYQCSHLFGRSSSSNDSKMTQSVSSDIQNDGSIQISGGSESTRNALSNSIKGMTQASQINSDLLANWDASITALCLDDAEKRSNLDIIDFSFIPIWDLFPTQELRNVVMAEVVAIGDIDGGLSNCSFTDAELGTDNYTIDLTNSNFTFGTQANSTLVKVLYANNTPILEVCNEYVPKIRGDRRITVFYPIYNGMTRIGQGLFPGDGEGNTPATLTFSGGDVYVNPIDGYGCYDKLQTVYYLHGNLYAENYGVSCIASSQSVKDHYLQFSGSNIKYPVVKIGSGYWTRCDIDEDMEFGYYDWDVYGEWTWCEYKEDTGPLYACYFVENEGTFLDSNTIYGWDYNNMYGANTKWFLPTSKDISNMKNYVGRNLKTLFRGQVSGYEAAFSGYYGRYDVTKSGKDYGQYELRNVGTLNLIAAKDTEKTGTLFALSPDYTITDLSAISHWTENYYPVRVYRTCYFNYSNLLK